MNGVWFCQRLLPMYCRDALTSTAWVHKVWMPPTAFLCKHLCSSFTHGQCHGRVRSHLVPSVGAVFLTFEPLQCLPQILQEATLEQDLPAWTFVESTSLSFPFCSEAGCLSYPSHALPSHTLCTLCLFPTLGSCVLLI